jgi:hypothetical protein
VTGQELNHPSSTDTVYDGAGRVTSVVGKKFGDPVETTTTRCGGDATTSEGIAASRTVLRGYDWLTVAADELAERLGGVDALRASGAFARVESLRSGGVWLLATEDYADCTGERVEAVWKALAPVLMRGTPSRDRAERNEAPVRLVFRDAAEVEGVDGGPAGDAGPFVGSGLQYRRTDRAGLDGRLGLGRFHGGW